MRDQQTTESKPEKKSLKLTLKDRLLRFGLIAGGAFGAFLFLVGCGEPTDAPNIHVEPIPQVKPLVPDTTSQTPKIVYQPPSLPTTFPKTSPTLVKETVTALKANRESSSIPLKGPFNPEEKAKSERAIFTTLITDKEGNIFQGTGVKIDYANAKYYIVATTLHGLMTSEEDISDFNMTPIGKDQKKKPLKISKILDSRENDITFLFFEKENAINNPLKSIPGYKVIEQAGPIPNYPIVYGGVPRGATENMLEKRPTTELIGDVLLSPDHIYSPNYNLVTLEGQVEDFGASGGAILTNNSLDEHMGLEFLGAISSSDKGGTSQQLSYHPITRAWFKNLVSGVLQFGEN